jgi:subtilisin family serine protease
LQIGGTVVGRIVGPLGLVKLTDLMQRSSGRPEIRVGLIDGPILISHPDLAAENIQEIPGAISGTCARADTAACRHGTFVAGMLCARRGSVAPAICPACTLLVRPIFPEGAGSHDAPSATSDQLAGAVIDSVDAGARVVNLSAALAWPSLGGEARLEEALNYAARREVVVVAAAGNQGAVGSTAITRHPAVISVAGCDLRGRPLAESNLGGSIGQRGLSAPAESITSLGVKDRPDTRSGTSVAAPFVTGTIALLWSEFPAASAAVIRLAVTQNSVPRRRTIAPPILDASAAYAALNAIRVGR